MARQRDNTGAAAPVDGSTRDEARRDGPFVGRHDELALLRGAALDAADGRPHIVFVEGDAGSGKTALTRRAVSELPAEFTVVTAQADELATDESMFVASQIAATTAGTPFAAGLELLGHLGELQEHGPVALVVEDLHWVDPASQRTLLSMARRLEQDRVLIVVTSRADRSERRAEDPGWERLRTDPRAATRIALGSLSVEDTVALAEASGRSLSVAAARRLHHHTAGHALHTTTLLAELTDSQLARPSDDLPAPRSLAAATLGRLGGVSPDAVAMASMLAVLNRATPLATLGRLVDVDDPTGALDELLATALVTWQPTQPLSPVSFVHPLHRVAVYEDLAPSRRRALHAAAAADADPANALAHRVAATDRIDDGLAAELDRIAHDEVQLGDLAGAARHLRWAAAVGSPGADAQRRILQAARMLLRAQRDDLADELRTEVEACEPCPLRDRVLGHLARHDGDRELAERLLDAAARHGVAAGETEVAAEALQLLSGLYSVVSDGNAAIDAARRTIELAPARDDLVRLARVTLAIGTGLRDGAVPALDLVDGQLADERAGAAVPDARDPELAAATGMLNLFAGRRHAAAADLTEAIRAARRGTALEQLPRAHLYLSQAQFGLGDWDGALVNARLALSLDASDSAATESDAQAHGAAATVLAARGELDAARAHLDEARAAHAGTIEGDFVIRIATAAVAAARGEHQQVIDALGDLVPGGDPTNVPIFSSMTWWPGVIAALLGCGRVDEASAHLAGFEQAVAVRSLPLQSTVHRLRGELAHARDDLRVAGRELDAAVELLGDDMALLERADTYLARSRLRRATGERRPALDDARAARALLEPVRAAPYLERVDEMIRALGGTTGSGIAPTRSPLELTEREQDVAALVANGLTNKEVAAELYVSVKAVEYHLRNIFGKLGISSRRELRAR